MPVSTMPNYANNDWQRRKPLKYRTGAEPIETLVIFASSVTADSDGRRLISAATILCEITSGNGDGLYGPYVKTATDGRQTIGATNQAYVSLVGHDVTLYDKQADGLWAFCVFESSEIYDVNSISTADLSTLQTAFPNAEWK